MRCEQCQGTGLVVYRDRRMLPWFPSQAAEPHPAGPCPSCGGCGIASCCDGAVGLVAETRRWAASDDDS